MTAKFKALSKAKKVLVVLGIFTAFMILVGATSDKKDNVELTKNQTTTPSASAKKPTIGTKTVEEKSEVPFQSLTQNDPGLEVGKSYISATGVNGQKIVIYEVTYTDGIETNRKQVSERLDPQPVNQMTNIGTKPKPVPAPAPKPKATASNCNPNYSGCVPNASDVDCAGGSGNGPAYVRGPIRVIGSDVYDLDRDGNGLACE